jgi:hypothetical protein
MAEPNATQQLFDIWRRQLEESAQAWTRMLGQTPPPPAPPDPLAFWRPVMAQGLEAFARLFAQTPVPPDLAAQWKALMDQWLEAWSKAFGQAMSTEAYAQLMGQTLDQWLAAQAPARKATEQALGQALATLNLASGTQLTAVARQIVELEERLERVEDGIAAILERLEERGPR